MTGKELIIYILQNNLEDVDMFKDGRICGFLTEADLAALYSVGSATVRAWYQLGYINAIMINDRLYFPKSDKNRKLFREVKRDEH